MDAESRFSPSAEWSAVTPGYEWPRNTEEQDIDYVYHGRMHNLPRSASKTVRIFLSSTFTDTYTERNLLMKNVFPEMRQYCRDKYDLDFQVVDMRWGVRHEASVDHSASELCMKEIKNCNEVSLGPTFVTLLSHRYGSRPLPVRIPESEMNLFMEELKKQSEDDLEFLLQWYLLDTNAIPAEYILKPLVRFEDIEAFLQFEENKKQPAKQIKKRFAKQEIGEEVETAEKTTEKYRELLQNGTKEFHEAEDRLKNIFRELTTNLLTSNRLTKEQAEKYHISVTEQEIINGITKNERRRDRCLAFVRQLNNINLKHKKAWRFIDMKGEGEIDQKAQKLMNTLRDETIPALLPPENIFRFETAWSDEEGVNEKDHAEYLQTFCNAFKKALTDQIDRGVHASTITSDKLFSEVLEHGHQCMAKVERFHGREDILQIIKDYLMSNCKQPLVIWGESGCGKTSILAKAANMVPEWLGDNKKLIIPVRFLGTTPGSSSIYQTLASICSQLVKLLFAPDSGYRNIPQDIFKMKEMFENILSTVPNQKRVVLFLDSLDQLAESNSAHLLHWLPTQLSDNVKIVVSVLSEEHGILDRLREIITDSNQYVEVPNIKTETSHAILKLWLELKNRRLSTIQEELVANLFMRSVRPLYLKLVFDEIYSWKSYEVPKFDCNTIQACLVRLFRQIETKHGQILVSKALGYLSASANGLTELEMEDLLSLDEEVLSDVFQFHIPPMRRLPSILWARIRHDLDEYIVDREADGTKAMAWYHRQFIEQANKRFLGTSGFHSNRIVAKALPLYLNLRDYFAGIWSGETPKPFNYTELQCKKLNLKDTKSEQIRHVSAQPTIFKEPDGSIDIRNLRYNLRKISELPHACSKIHTVEDITEFVAKHIGFNPEFFGAWIKNKPWEEISRFITNITRSNINQTKIGKKSLEIKKQFEGADLPQELSEELEQRSLKELNETVQGNAAICLQMSTVHQCLLLSYISVRENPTFIGTDVCGRLLIYQGVFDGIDEWINYCDTRGRHLCALVAPHLQLETPGSELLFILNNHSGPVEEAMLAASDKSVCYSFSTKLVAVCLNTAQVLFDTRPRNIPDMDSFSKAIATRKYIFAVLLFNPWLYIFKTSGEIAQIIKMEDLNLGVMVTQIYNFCDQENRIVLLFGLKPHLAFLTTHGKWENDFKISVLKRRKKSFLIIAAFGSGCVFVLENVPMKTSQITKIKVEFDDDSNVHSLQDEEVILTFHGMVSVSDMSKYIRGDTIMFNTQEDSLIKMSRESVHVVWFQDESPKSVSFHLENKEGQRKYGNCLNVKLGASWTNSKEDITGIVLTTTHLLLLVHDTFHSKPCGKASSKEKRDTTSVLDEERNLKLILTIKKSYETAEIAQGPSVLIAAAKDGNLDLFQLEEDGGRITGRFFMTIKGHSQNINKILTTAENVRNMWVWLTGMVFLTASTDGTMKSWLIARAGVTRKYVQHFDRAEEKQERFDTILPGEETAIVSSAIPGRIMYEWDILRGRIARTFEHPSKNGRLHHFTTDADRSKLYAVDTNGTLYIWNLTNDEKSHSAKELRRKTTKHSVKQGKGTIKVEVSKTFKLDEETVKKLQANMLDKYVGLQLISVSNGLVHKMPDNSFIHIQLGDKPTVHKIESGQEMLIVWKLTEQYALFLVDGDDPTLLLYDALSKNTTKFNTSEICEDKDLFYHAKYNEATGELIFLMPRGIVLWNPISNKIRESAVTNSDSMAFPWLTTSKSGVCIFSCMTHNSYQGFKVTKEAILVEPWTRRFWNWESVRHVTLTHDGKYILYMTGGNTIYLRRYSDRKLLALYTMYEDVCALSVSTNNWFLIVSTLDKRIFTLLIADPDEREHDERIRYVRTMNPGLEIDQAMALMGEANNIDSYDNSDISSDEKDERLIRVAKKRLEKGNVNENIVFCLQSDEDSMNSDSNIDSDPDTVMPRDTNDVTVFDNGLYPTAHDGAIFSPKPCSLQ